MKRRITLSIALVLSIVLVSLMSSDSTVKAQQPERFVWDTGIVTLRENQILRMTLAKYISRDGGFRGVIRRLSYTQGTCNGDGVCNLAVASQDTSDPVTLMTGEAVSIDFRRCISPICGGVRGIVLSNSRDVKVNAMIIDSATGEVVSLVKNESLKEVIFE